MPNPQVFINSANPLSHHRGFIIGVIREKTTCQYRQHDYRAAWRSIFESDWIIAILPLGTPEDAIKMAHSCIDYTYVCEAEEICRGRRLTRSEFPHERRPDPHRHPRIGHSPLP